MAAFAQVHDSEARTSVWVEDIAVSSDLPGLARVLVAGGGRLFLVPDRWVATNRTTVVPYDAGVRIQLVPSR